MHFGRFPTNLSRLFARGESELTHGQEEKTDVGGGP